LLQTVVSDIDILDIDIPDLDTLLIGFVLIKLALVKSMLTKLAGVGPLKGKGGETLRREKLTARPCRSWKTLP